MNFKQLLTTSITLAMLTSCITTRKDLGIRKLPDTEIEQVLYYASLAGSSHNTQPWLVDILSDSLLLIRADFTRKLNVVDPTARGLYISLGAFIENLCIASEYYGFLPRVFLVANTSKDDLVAEVKLVPQPQARQNISKIMQRTTLRIPFKKEEICDEHIQILSANNSIDYHFFASSSDAGQFISQKTIDAYTQQANRENAKVELANWIRFSNKDVKAKRDGLTTAGMGIQGVSGFMVSRFFSPAASKKQSFVDAGINKTLQQAQNCGGWLLITQPSNNPEDWISTGRFYQRANLACRDLMIGFHPMNQMIEESNFEGIVNEKLNLSGHIQFVARIGYVDDYPNPVSVRRDTKVFVRDFRVK